MLNALVQSGVPIQGLQDGYLAPPDPANPDTPRHVLTFKELNEWNADHSYDPIASSTYNDAIKAAMNATMGESVVGGIDDQLASRYNAVTEDVDPQR